MKETITVKEMSCGGCKVSIEEAVRGLLGVISAEANVERAELALEFDENKVTLADIREAVEKAGFETD